jgi:hypothetical protein
MDWSKQVLSCRNDADYFIGNERQHSNARHFLDFMQLFTKSLYNWYVVW